MTTGHDIIAVVDNGGQFTHLIATKLRNAVNVKSIIVGPESDPDELEDVKGIILSGSPASLVEEDRPGFNPRFLQVDVPVLGLCYGLHLIADGYGGKVEPGDVREYGHATLKVEDSPLFTGLSRDEQVWMSHGDKVSALPEGFTAIGATGDCPFAAIQNAEGTRFGLQFHPEVEYTTHGVDILRNFAVEVCGARPDWTVGSYLDEKVREIEDVVGERSVFLLASGGVDSTVCAALLARAIPPERLRAVHVDNGLMRKGESALVKRDLAGIGVDAEVLDASEDFLRGLAGEVEPERKRNIIGQLFIDVSDRAAERMGLHNWVLAQGTIYPDTIESGSTTHADVIKTHHNRVPIIEEMIGQGRIIEPIAELYKVEVRELGELLGLPKERVWRHPFPGPGLGIRLLCSGVGEGGPEAAGAWKGVEELTRRCGELLGPEGLEGLVLPVRSVGVMGDARSYEHPLLMWWREPREEGPSEEEWEKLWALTTNAANRIKGVNRGVLLVHPPHPPSVGGGADGDGGVSTAETVRPAWLTLEKCDVNRERLDLLREADSLVMGLLGEFGVMDEIWQCPTVILPLNVNGKPLVVVRPIYSTRAMTARAAPLPAGMIDRLGGEMAGLGLGGWGIDLTHKPPGTIEWE